MRPTTPELVEAIATVLRERIAPLLADQPWPASELRTIDALLALVGARVEHEAAVLAADNADLVPLLHELAAAGVPVPACEPTPGASAHAWNVELRSALEAAIHHIHSGTHQAQVEAVRRYLIVAAQREQVLYAGMTGRRLF